MKRTRGEIENTSAVISRNIGLLPDEIILHMTTFLPEEEITRLCQTDARFAYFCQRFDLTAERQAIKHINEIAPYGEILNTPQKQWKAIQRGQNTVYEIEFKRIRDRLFNFQDVIGIDQLNLGYRQVGARENPPVFVEIRGPPVAAGTKLWLFGLVEIVPIRNHRLGQVVFWQSYSMFKLFDRNNLTPEIMVTKDNPVIHELYMISGDLHPGPGHDEPDISDDDLDIRDYNFARDVYMRLYQTVVLERQSDNMRVLRNDQMAPPRAYLIFLQEMIMP